MCKDAHIAIFDDSESNPDALNGCNSELVELELNIFGNSLHLYITAENKPAGLSALVPLAQLLNTKITTIIKSALNKEDTITCQANCSHCCKYLVPLTIPEAMWLREEVMQMPKWKRKFVYKSTTLTAKHILELAPKSFLQELIEAQNETGSKSNDISKWYHSMKLACPFLLSNKCTIYNQRPMACREHLVVNSASGFCNPGNTKQPQLLQMPISLVMALAELTSELEQKPVETIILPFVLAWCDENYEYFEHTWPTSELVGRFVEILSGQNEGL